MVSLFVGIGSALGLDLNMTVNRRILNDQVSCLFCLKNKVGGLVKGSSVEVPSCSPTVFFALSGELGWSNSGSRSNAGLWKAVSGDISGHANGEDAARWARGKRGLPLVSFLAAARFAEVGGRRFDGRHQERRGDQMRRRARDRAALLV